MTDKEINIACAEACGVSLSSWYCPRCRECVAPQDVSFNETHTKCGEAVHADGIPSYTTDLNACHEMEQVLDSQVSDTRSLWLDHLAACCNWPKTKNALELNFEVQYLVARSTARQRAEAFLKTVGKWMDA